MQVLKAAGFDLIVLETSGIGQSDTEILDHSDLSLYVMTPEYGAATQLEKIDMLDFADVIALNKFDKRGALDALRDVRKQYQRNHGLWEQDLEQMPVHGTIASQFNDPGTNGLYRSIMDALTQKTSADFPSELAMPTEMSEKIYIIPPSRTRYLSEISEQSRRYDKRTAQQAEVADKLYGLQQSVLTFGGPDLLEEAQTSSEDATVSALIEKFNELHKDLDPHLWAMLQGWRKEEARYSEEFYVYQVRGKEISVPNHTRSLSQTPIAKVALPKFKSWG